MNAGKISVIAVLLSLLSFSILPDCALAKYSGGAGTDGDPYRIGSAADLLTLAADATDYNKRFVLTADIDLDPKLPGRKVFTTAVIASDTDNTFYSFNGNPFTGIFDGNGHTISNMTINTGGIGNDFLGLFGSTVGQIKNLGLKNVNITGGDVSACLGGIAGMNGGRISNCYSTGEIIAGDESPYLGGLAGYNYNNINNCFSRSTVSGGDISSSIGGLVGRNDSCSISNCYSSGAVTGGSGAFDLGGAGGKKHRRHYQQLLFSRRQRAE